jgi:hypothetical protein
MAVTTMVASTAMTDTRRPVHLAVLVGLSATAYAISLAGVTALQSATDARIAADRAPAGRAADLLASGHDELEMTLDYATQSYGLAAGRYAELGTRIVDMETSLADLEKRVGKVTGAAKALPNHVSLPTISTSTRVVTRTKVVHATTGASG